MGYTHYTAVLRGLDLFPHTRHHCHSADPQIPKLRMLSQTSRQGPPIQHETIGWKYYLFYAIFNFLFNPIIWCFYVETANLSLEQVDPVKETYNTMGRELFQYIQKCHLASL